jgi:hypothetical protein
MSIFRTVYQVERNGRVFLLHWKNRYDPMTLAMGGVAAGTGLQIGGSLQQGRDANAIAKQRAAVDIAQAEAVERAAGQEARVRAEGTRRLLASQRSAAAAGGIRINAGAPLVIAADTRRLAARETGFMLDRSRAEAEAYRQSAAIERATGKLAKKRAKRSALMQALTGATNIAMMGYQGGMFSGKSGAGIPLRGAASPLSPANHLGNYYA